VNSKQLSQLIACIKPDLVTLCDSEKLTAESRDALHRVAGQLTPPNLLALLAALEAKLNTPIEVGKLTITECEEISGLSRDYCDGWCTANDWAIHRIRAAGFKVRGDE
jgi:hypothetical protein